MYCLSHNGPIPTVDFGTENTWMILHRNPQESHAESNSVMRIHAVACTMRIFLTQILQYAMRKVLRRFGISDVTYSARFPHWQTCRGLALFNGADTWRNLPQRRLNPPCEQALWQLRAAPGLTFLCLPQELTLPCCLGSRTQRCNDRKLLRFSLMWCLQRLLCL